MADKIILTDNPKRDALEYIAKNFEFIVPFMLRNRYHFQIRILPETQEALSKELVDLLLRYSEPHDRGSSWEADVRYNKDRYWEHTKSYIYNYTAKKAIIIETNIVDDYEGYFHEHTVTLFDKQEFPHIITKNMGCCEDCSEHAKVMFKHG